MKSTEKAALVAAFSALDAADAALLSSTRALGVSTPATFSAAHADLTRAVSGVGKPLTALGALIDASVVDADPPPPPPPPPPVGVLRALPGGKFADAAGKAKVLRGVESWAFGSTDLVKMCAAVKTLGANAVSPLFMGTDLTRLKALCEAVKSAGLVLCFNPDQGGQLGFMLSDGAVAVLKQYESTLVLNYDTELSGTQDGGYSASQWVSDMKALVAQVRAKGFKCPIRIGSPNAGRAPRYALDRGAEVLAADPEHNLVFACQVYWGTSYYQGLAGFGNGAAGRAAFLAAAAASPVCFLVGFDATDDAGDTGEPAMCDQCQALGLSYQHWELADPDGSDDDLVQGDLATLTTLGRSLQARWRAESH